MRRSSDEAAESCQGFRCQILEDLPGVFIEDDFGSIPPKLGEDIAARSAERSGGSSFPRTICSSKSAPNMGFVSTQNSSAEEKYDQLTPHDAQNT